LVSFVDVAVVVLMIVVVQSSEGRMLRLESEWKVSNVCLLSFKIYRPTVHCAVIVVDLEVYLQCFDAVGWAAGRASVLQINFEWCGTSVVISLE